MLVYPVFPGFYGIFDYDKYLQIFLLPLAISPSKVVNGVVKPTYNQTTKRSISALTESNISYV